MSRAALEELRPEWDALWGSIPDRTPFQSSAWVFPWWDTFGSGELRVLAFRDGDRLVGIAPLYLSHSREGDPELRLLGAGISDYLDIVVEPGAEQLVLAGLTRALDTCVDHWTFCGFDHLRPESALLALSLPCATSTEAPDVPCPVLPLPASFDRIQESIGTGLLKKIRNQRQRAQRLGGLVVEQAGPDNIEEVLAALFALHRARWVARGTAGMLEDPKVWRFHCAAVPELLRTGLLRLYELRVGNRTAAVHYGLYAAGTAYFYIGGFDPAFSCLGPGTLAIAAAVERAILDGATVFDFLSGCEAYKYQWGATDRCRVNRHFRRGPATGGVA